jgi:hypothetical protein
MEGVSTENFSGERRAPWRVSPKREERRGENRSVENKSSWRESLQGKKSAINGTWHPVISWVQSDPCCTATDMESLAIKQPIK